MPRTAIDESQLVEGIFPVLKERVRINKEPGQFILSGSVRFTSKASIRESLTGRSQYLELIPMTVSEIRAESLPIKLNELFSTYHMPTFLEQISVSKRIMNSVERDIEKYRVNGGLPGICFIRKHQTRNDKILDQLKTILDRDLRQIYSTQLSFDIIFSFLQEIAINEGRPFHYQYYRRVLGLSPITQKKLLYALEAIFLIRRIPVEGVSNGFACIFEDQAEAYYLSKAKQTIDTQCLHLLYRNMRAEFFYRTDRPTDIFQFSVQNGKTVPIVFRNRDSCVGFLFTDSDQITRDLRGTASSFLRRYENSKIVFVSNGKNVDQVDHRSFLCPLSRLV